MKRRREPPPLHAAVGRCDFEAVKRLLAEGHDPNQLDGYRLTALFYAVTPSGGAPEMVEVLLAGGADPTVTAPDGKDLVAYANAYVASALEAMEARHCQEIIERYRRARETHKRK